MTIQDTFSDIRADDRRRAFRFRALLLALGLLFLAGTAIDGDLNRHDAPTARTDGVATLPCVVVK